MIRQAKASSAGSNQRQATGLGRNRIAFACLLALLAFSGISASSALGGETRLPESFSPLAEPESITDPNGIALDEASGNIFVNDTGTHVEILGAEGGPPAGLLPPYLLTSGCSSGVGANSGGVAVDNSATSPAKGTVYVVCTNGKIRRFTRDPMTEKYVAGAEISYPGSASAAGATVDANGNLHVSNFGTSSIYKFDPAGTLNKTIAFSASPSSIALDSSGSLFYRVTGQNRVLKCPADAFGEINPSACSQFISSGASAVVVDRTTDTLYVALGNRVVAYDAITLTKKYEFGEGNLVTTRGITVNSATDRIYVSDTGAGKDHIAVFGPPVPTPDVTTQAASNVKGATATLNGLVNPNGVEVTDCFFEYGLTAAYGKTAPCQEAIPTDSNDHGVTAAIAGLEPNGTTYHFRLVVDSANGEVKGGDRTLVTGKTVFTEAATAIDDTTATLNGIVRPEGEPFIGCEFEYGTALDYGQSVPCSPSAGSIPDDFDAHAVTGALTELEPNTTYHFRLAATNADGTVRDEDRTFTTIGPPQILEQRPVDVDRDSATLHARINPSGSSTHYHFDFGTDTSYGIRIPADTDLNLAAGTEPVIVRGFRRGLQEKSVYWFRVVATNSEGTTVGPDQRLETLNEHDLPNNRAFELVTPADKGTAGSIVDDLFSAQQLTQASPDGESFIYPLLNGLDSSTAGGWLRQSAGRTASGWLSTQVSAPSLVPPPRSAFGIAMPSKLRFVAPDNKCGLLESYNPLTADTPQAGVEIGVENLYVWRAEGGEVSYELVSDRLPLNPEFNPVGAFYSKVDASDDCRRVYFRTGYELIGGASGLYEWDEGTLRDAGVLPDGSVGADALFASSGSAGRAILGGEVEAQSTTGRWNAVSPDGSRVFFTAIKNEVQTLTFSGFDDGDTFTLGNLPTGSTGCKASSAAGVEYKADSLAFPMAIDTALEATCSDSARDDFVVTGSPTTAKIAFQGQFAGANVPLLSCATVSGGGSCSAAETTTSGKPAVFMRVPEDSDPVVEISASETGIPTNGARFEAASPDGTRVFFRANYGIDAEGSSAEPTGEACGPRRPETGGTLGIEKKPCDLYAYDVASEELTDLSADTNPADPAGAQIQGTVAVDEDGSHVYFAALGQLVAGKGRTYAQNTAGFGSANVYLARLDEDGELSEFAYVTTLAQHGPDPSDVNTGDLYGPGQGPGAALMRVGDRQWNANTTADGGELLFVSSLNLTGWDSGGIDKYAAYLYSADTGRLACISCRPDGLPSVALPRKFNPTLGQFDAAQSSWLLAGPEQGHRPRSISEDGSRVVFTSPDVLAPGAVSGKRNVYQWQQGHVTFLATAEGAGVNGLNGYRGMSASGDDVFIATGEQLAPQDRDFLSDVYDVRVDGGIPFSEPPPDCQVDEAVPLVPNQIYCQGDKSAQPPETAGAFPRDENLKPKPAGRCKRIAHQAKRLSNRAKRLSRNARKVNRHNHRRAVRMNRKARRLGKRAKGLSNRAKRCRRPNRRAGR